MADLEKVVSYAEKLGSGTPVQLRWEGAGDGLHAYTLIRSLMAKTYAGTLVRIKFKTTMNHYEKQTDPIYQGAFSLYEQLTDDLQEDQAWECCPDVDVTRDSRSLVYEGGGQQEIAHIMFVRNIMPTDGSGSSQTNASATLLGIHDSTVRQRANSLTDQGRLRIGMSGTPAIASAPQGARMNMPASSLFQGYGTLSQAANESGLTLVTGAKAKGRGDVDTSVPVMKNDGTSLGYKPTYYMTFVARTY